MIRRVNAHVSMLLAVSGIALALPPLVQAESGGATPSGGVSTPGGSTSSAQVQPGDVTVTASGNGITFATVESGVLRRPQQFSGTASSADAGQTIEIQRRGRETHWQWADTTHATIGPDGSFSAVWPTNHIGRFAVRATLLSTQGAQAAAASPSLTMIVYRPALATQYGPGFYHRRTACGQVLHRDTLGVANRTLGCGTPVSILYHGRTIVVPVIDRGPYANGADWDLTEATGRALGIPGTATIGAVSLPHHAG